MDVQPWADDFTLSCRYRTLNPLNDEHPPHRFQWGVFQEPTHGYWKGSKLNDSHYFCCSCPLSLPSLTTSSCASGSFIIWMRSVLFLKGMKAALSRMKENPPGILGSLLEPLPLLRVYQTSLLKTKGKSFDFFPDVFLTNTWNHGHLRYFKGHCDGWFSRHGQRQTVDKATALSHWRQRPSQAQGRCKRFTKHPSLRQF